MFKPMWSLARHWLPPILASRIQSFSGGRSSFAGDYSSWREAAAVSEGYDADEILSKVLDASIKVKNGEVAYERDSVTFDQPEYSWPLLSGLMWAAARNNGQLNVLDYGGALGSSYFQNLLFMKALPSIKWNVVEQAHYVQAGQQYIEDQNIRFYESISECLVKNRPNVVLLSSVLQYLETPFDLLKEVSGVGAMCLIVDRTPFNDHDWDRLLIQKVPPQIYVANYPMWVFSRSKFEAFLDSEWSLVSKHQCPEGVVSSKDGLPFLFQGMMFEAKP